MLNKHNEINVHLNPSQSLIEIINKYPNQTFYFEIFVCGILFLFCQSLQRKELWLNRSVSEAMPFFIVV